MVDIHGGQRVTRGKTAVFSGGFTLAGLTLAAVTAVAGSLLAGCSTTGNADDLSNPDTQQQVLEGGPPSARALAIQVGGTFTEGWDIVDVTGTRPVRIVDITFPDTDPGLTHLPDPLLAGPDRGPASIQYFPTFPPARWSGIDPSTVEPAIGAVLDPVADPEGNGWELLLGARPETAGNHWRRGARIHYEVLDRQGQPVGGVQALDLESDLYICATIGKPRGSADCDFPDDYSLSDTYPD